MKNKKGLIAIIAGILLIIIAFLIKKKRKSYIELEPIEKPKTLDEGWGWFGNFFGDKIKKALQIESPGDYKELSNKPLNNVGDWQQNWNTYT